MIPHEPTGSYRRPKMTIREFLSLLGAQPLILLAVFGGLPVLTAAWGLIHKRSQSPSSPWKYGYSVLVWVSCVPGVLSGVLLAYAVFFARENLLDLDLLVYGLPLASLLATLFLIGRRMSFSEIPGLGRLWALVTLIAVSFALALAIDRTRIFVGFFGSIDRLFLLFAGILVVLKTSLGVLMGRKKKEG